MSDAISSSEDLAQERASNLNKGGESFSLLALASQSGMSNTTPAGHHDDCANNLKASLGEYKSSIRKDAAAIMGVASTFSDTDRQLASKLMG